MQENQLQGRVDRGNNAEIARKIPSQNKDIYTKFHFKVRKPHFKLRKALFKRGLKRNGKNNVLEFDVEKYDDIFFFQMKKDYPFNFHLPFLVHS